MNLEEKRISTKTIYDGSIVKLEVDEAELPDGKTAIREVVRHPGGVGVVPIDEEGFVYLVKQYRYPFSKITTEIPAGKLDSKEENPKEAGKRELMEETGLRAEKFTFLGSIYASPGFCDEEIYLYLAEGLVQGESDPDEDEFVAVTRMHIDALVAQIAEGNIHDGKTVSGILLAKNKLGL